MEILIKERKDCIHKLREVFKISKKKKRNLNIFFKNKYFQMKLYNIASQGKISILGQKKLWLKLNTMLRRQQPQNI